MPPGTRILGTGIRILGTGIRILGTGIRILGTGIRILGTGISILGTGIRILGTVITAFVAVCNGSGPFFYLLLGYCLRKELFIELHPATLPWNLEGDPT